MTSNDFSADIAVIVGIAAYDPALGTLQTPVRDATAVARLLASCFGYQVILQCDGTATLPGLRTLLHQELPKRVPEGSRLLFYFAGHGIAQPNAEIEGPQGYLVPHGAISQVETHLPMSELHEALKKLPCRHLLVILDCCFSGAFRWASQRPMLLPEEILYEECYKKWLRHPAHWALASAAHDEHSFDPPDRRRGQKDDLSPFASALRDGLSGEADYGKSGGDGIITLAELNAYLLNRLAPRQTPLMLPLPGQSKGAFVFRDFRRLRPLVSAEQMVILREDENPYRGLEPYGVGQAELFFGRTKAARQLLRHVRIHPLTVVTGPSGSGKSSLVQAGLQTRLQSRRIDRHQRRGRMAGWIVPSPVRVTIDPFTALVETLAQAGGPQLPSPGELRSNPVAARSWISAWVKAHPCERLLLVVDQAEELITRVSPERTTQSGELPEASSGFLACLGNLLEAGAGRARVLIAVRSDYEPDLEDGPLASLWNSGRFVVPLLSRDELREVIEGPAGRKALYFDDPALVDRLIDEVIGMPGGLPLLSYALSRLYLAYFKNMRRDRLLTAQDLALIGSEGSGAPGGIVRILREEADRAVRELPDPEHREVLWRILLRMVNLTGARPIRRQVPLSELDYFRSGENQRRDEVLRQFIKEERLLVSGRDGIEPAHDELLVSWPELTRKIDAARELIPIHRRLTETTAAWASQAKRLYWGLDLALLGKVERRFLPEEWLNKAEMAYLSAARQERRWRAGLQWAAIAAILILSFGAILLRNSFIQQRERARLERSESLAHGAEAAGRQQDFAASGLLAVESLRLTKTDAALTSLALSKSWSWPLVSLLKGHTGPLSHISYSPDGRWLVSTAYYDDNVARLWNARSFQPGPTLPHKDRIYRAVFHPSRQRVAVTDYANSVWIWDFAADEAHVACSVRHEDARSSIFESQGRYLITYSHKTANVWDLDQCKDARTLGKPLATVSHGLMNFDPISMPSAFLAVSNNEVLIWNIESGKPVLRQRLDHPGVTCIDISTDARKAITSGKDGTARIWDFSGTNPVIKQELRHDGRINSGKFSKDGQLAVTASADGTAKLWEESDGVFKLKALLAHGAEVKAAFIDPTGRWVTTWSYPRKDAGPGSLEGDILWVWEANTGLRTAALLSDIIALDFSPDGVLLAVAGFDKTASIWRVGPARTEIPRDGFIDRDADKAVLGLDSDGKLILVDRYNKEIRIWNLPEAQERFPPLKLADQILPTLFLSRDGTRIVANDGRHVAQWNSKTGEPIVPPLDITDSSPWISHLSGGPLFVAASRGPEEKLQLWDLRSGRVHEVKSELETIEETLVSENGSYAALVGTEKGTRGAEGLRTELWDIRKGELIGRFQKGLRLEAVHPQGLSIVGTEGGPSNRFTVLVAGENKPHVIEQDGWVMSARFSSDGSMLVTASREGAAWIWDTQHWEHRGSLSHGAWISYATYDPRGEVIATTATDGSTKIWSASTYEVLAVLQHHQPQRICLFSPDSLVLVSQSADNATVWHWRDEMVDPEEVRLSLRFSTARQLNGILSERESWLRLPAGLPKPGSRASVKEAARKLLAKPPNRSTVSSAADAVLGDSDPALAWIDLYSALGGHPRSNGYRLLVLEELERRETTPVGGEALRLLLAATRAEGAEDPDGGEGTADRLREKIRRRALDLLKRGDRHPVVEALAHLKRPIQTS